MKRVIIIGGGASGMACALIAAKRGLCVTVLERERKTLRKLAASGNGRGNLLNRGELRYAGDKDFAKAVFTQVTPKDVEGFWHSVGVPLAEEDERVYPSCFQASQAAEALRLCVLEAGAEVRCATKVISVNKGNGRFFIEAEQAIYSEDTVRKNGKIKQGELLQLEKCQYEADAVVLAFGGSAAPEFGTNGSAYVLGTELGHHLTEIRPALCALTTRTSFPDSLIGQRARVRLCLRSLDGKLLAQSQGEILFADHAISGIAAMQLARFVERGCELHIDFMPTVCGEDIFRTDEVLSWLQQRQKKYSNRSEDDLLRGCAPEALLRQLQGKGGLCELAKRITDFVLPISGTRDFSAAQVTAGGFRTEEFSPDTMESTVCKGLYALGEALNVDGDCGGYNLMFAAATGILAGRSIPK